jgi:hypothetical protein
MMFDSLNRMASVLVTKIPFVDGAEVWVAAGEAEPVKARFIIKFKCNANSHT